VGSLTGGGLGTSPRVAGISNGETHCRRRWERNPLGRGEEIPTDSSDSSDGTPHSFTSPALRATISPDEHAATSVGPAAVPISSRTASYTGPHNHLFGPDCVCPSRLTNLKTQ
jgi:hypothetical protein